MIFEDDQIHRVSTSPLLTIILLVKQLEIKSIQCSVLYMKFYSTIDSVKSNKFMYVTER